MEPRHIVSVVQRFLSADLVRQHGVVCKFDIIGEGGGVFNLDLKNGEISVMFSFTKQSRWSLPPKRFSFDQVQ